MDNLMTNMAILAASFPLMRGVRVLSTHCILTGTEVLIYNVYNVQYMS